MNVNDLPKYKCHKVVRAAKITAIAADFQDGHCELWFDRDGKQSLNVGADFYERHEPRPGKYFVAYDDGYQSVSPAEAFEAGYSPLIEGALLSTNADFTESLKFIEGESTNLTFSTALVWLKVGKRVQRAGWNGKGLWLEYVAPRTSVDLPFIQLIYPVPGDGSLPYPNGARVPWAPSQTDMLADDWRVVS